MNIKSLVNQWNSLSSLQKAVALNLYLEHHPKSLEKITSKLALSKSSAINYRRVGRLPNSVLSMAARYNWTLSHLLTSFSLSEDPDEICALINSFGRCSVSKIKNHVINQQNTVEIKELNRITEKLSTLHGTPIEAHFNKGAGSISFSFKTLDQLDHILEVLGYDEEQ